MIKMIPYNLFPKGIVALLQASFDVFPFPCLLGLPFNGTDESSNSWTKPMNKVNKKLIKGRKPKVSVILPIFNSASYLEDCLNSILNQSYQNFEVIAVDDCSTDGSYGILRRFAKKNPKIKVYRNVKNKGVSETAKKAIDHARGDYLARMDADDIMPSSRLQKQLAYLRSNKKTVAVGGQVLIIDSKNNIIGKKPFPLTFKEIYRYIFRFIPLQQAALTIARKRLPEDFVYYRDGMNTAEEVELIFKLFLHGRVENLNSIMLLYRHHDKNTSFLNVKETFLLTLIARIKAVFRYNYQPTFVNVILTFMQAIFVLILPKKAVLLLYKAVREGTLEDLPSLVRYNNTSIKSLLIKG